MQLPLLNEPAVLRLADPASLAETGKAGRIVAEGPFALLACGYLAVAPADRGQMTLCSASGEHSLEQIEQAAARWRAGARA